MIAPMNDRKSERSRATDAKHAVGRGLLALAILTMAACAPRAGSVASSTSAASRCSDFGCEQ